MSETVVGTKLKLTSEGQEALEHFKKGFEHIDEKVKDVTHDLVSMAKQAAAVAVGFQLSGMIDSVKEFGAELVEGAAHLENQNKELMGLISLTNKAPETMGELSEAAAMLGERLEGLALSSRVSKESLVDAFEMIASRTSGTADHVEDVVNEMAIASRALPGGMQTIAAGWRDIEAGIIRPKNALLQLMKQTGVVEGPLKKVAKSLSAMMVTPAGQEKVFAMAEEAIGRMSKKMKDAPPTFDQVLISLKNVREMAFESMGMPILRSLVPPLERVRLYLVGHREELVHLAQTMGTRVGEWVVKASELVKEGFEYVRTHADEIMRALQQGATAIKDAIAFMVAHRELLLGLAAAKFVGGPMLGKAGSIAAALPSIGGALGKAAGQGAPMIGLAAGAGAAGAAALGGAAAAAVGSWMLADQQLGKLETESAMTFDQLIRHFVIGIDNLSKASDNIMNLQAAVRRLAAEEKNVEVATADMEHFIQTIERAGRTAVAAGDMTQAAYDAVLAKANQQAETHAKAAAAFDDLNAAAGEALGIGGISAAAQAMQHVTSAYHQASMENADAADKAARRILEANSNLVTALVGGPGTVEMALKKLQSLASGGDSDGVKLPPIQFGPNTINIKQDFRDQDPDRVAIVFRRDVTRQAVQRIGARTGSAFGY
jgi:hypothetical protein